MSNKILKRIVFVQRLIKEGKVKQVWKSFSNRIKSEDIAYGLKRDLNKDHPKPRVLMGVSVRLAKESDGDYFTMDNSNNGLINPIPDCYVAVTKEDIPCFRLWMIDSSQNSTLNDIWKGTFPELKKDEVLLESAFTIPKYRGLGLQPFAVYSISDKAKDFGANYAITFSSLDNINSLRSLDYAGFKPFTLRREKYFLFKKSVIFEDIPSNLLEYYNKINRRKLKSKK